MEQNSEIFSKMPELHEQLRIIALVANERVTLCSKDNEFVVKDSIAAMDDVYQAQIALIEAQRNHVKAFSAYLEKNPEYAAEFLKAGASDISKSAVCVDNFVKKVSANKELLGKSVQQAWATSSETVKTGVEKFLGVTGNAFISGATNVAELGGKVVGSVESFGKKMNTFAKFVAAIPGKLMDHSIQKGIDIRDAGFEMAKKTVETTKEFVSNINDGVEKKVSAASNKIDQTLESIEHSKAVIATDAIIGTGVSIGKSFLSSVKSFIDNAASDIKTAYERNLVLAEKAHGITSSSHMNLVGQNNKKPEKEFIEAVKAGDWDVAGKIFESGGVNQNLKIDGTPILSLALLDNKLEFAKNLINSGADVNLPADKSSLYTRMTPIHMASSVAAVDLLAASKDLNIDAKIAGTSDPLHCMGETALHAAAISGNKDIAAALLRAGADSSLPYSKDEYRYSVDSVVHPGNRVIRGGKTINDFLDSRIEEHGDTPKEPMQYTITTPKGGPDLYFSNAEDAAKAFVAIPGDDLPAVYRWVDGEDKRRTVDGIAGMLYDPQDKNVLVKSVGVDGAGGDVAFNDAFKREVARQAQMDVVIDPYDDIVNKATEKLGDKGVTGVIRDANKENGSYMGTVVAKNDKFAAIDIGRNHVVVVPNAISNSKLDDGQKVNLKFQNGVGRDVGQGQGQEKVRSH